jgi:hypothetical protein
VIQESEEVRVCVGVFVFFYDVRAIIGFFSDRLGKKITKSERGTLPMLPGRC